MAVTRFPVEAGHLLMFGRAIGDDAAGAIAPPTFTMAVAQFDEEYRLRPKPGEEWFGSGAGPGIAPEGGSGLHAEQHFEYHRPLRAGDTLTATSRPGRSWDKTGRTGTLRFTEQITEFRDDAGELVVTARMVGVKVDR